MAWGLRICLGVVVLAYAAWLGWPVIQALSVGAAPTQVWSQLTPGGSVMAMGLAGLLLAAVPLYGLAGVATALRLGWAPGLYFLGFLAEIALRLTVGTEARPVPTALDIATRVDTALRPYGVGIETTPLALAALLALGLGVLATGVWRGQKGAALTRVWTQPPVWAEA